MPRRRSPAPPINASLPPRALTLLNDTLRRAKLAQRLAVLQAAAWLIDVLEKLTAVS